jgi:hypothetical protein
MRDTEKSLVVKPEGKGPLEEPRHRCENNIKMDLKEIGWEGMDWIHLTQDRDQWWALLNIVLNLCVPEKAGIFLTS